MWFLALLACGTPPPKEGSHDSAAPDDETVETGDSDEPPDTAGDSGDSGDTASTPPDACALPHDAPPLACTLRNPGPVDIGTIDAVYARASGANLSLSDFNGGRNTTDCPAYIDDGVGETWTGGCTDADGNSWTGTATRTVEGTEEAFLFADFGEVRADGTTFTWDGAWDFWLYMEGYYTEMALTYSVAGSRSEYIPNGTFTVDGSVGYINQRAFGSFTLDDGANDWCLANDVSYGYGYDGCENLYGWWQVQGDRTATLVEVGRYPDCACGCWNPSDGEPEEFCRE